MQDSEDVRRECLDKGFRLERVSDVNSCFIGFNMLDPVIDDGDMAMSPLPPGIFGSREGTLEGANPVTHKVVDGKVQRRSIAEARPLMVDAGYPNGRDARTGKPLVLKHDFYAQATTRDHPRHQHAVGADAQRSRTARVAVAGPAGGAVGLDHQPHIV